MKDSIAVDAITQIRFIKDNVQGRIVQAVNYLQTLIYILVYNDRYTKDKYKDCKNKDNIIIALIQYYKGLFLYRLIIRPFV